MNAIAALHKMATKEIMAVPVASCTHALPGHGYPRDAPKFVQQTSHTHYCLATLFLCPVDTLCLGGEGHHGEMLRTLQGHVEAWCYSPFSRSTVITCHMAARKRSPRKGSIMKNSVHSRQVERPCSKIIHTACMHTDMCGVLPILLGLPDQKGSFAQEERLVTSIFTVTAAYIFAVHKLYPLQAQVNC